MRTASIRAQIPEMIGPMRMIHPIRVSNSWASRLLQALDRADEARRHFDACLELALAEV
jgi:hypothetical protein